MTIPERPGALARRTLHTCDNDGFLMLAFSFTGRGRPGAPFEFLGFGGSCDSWLRRSRFQIGYDEADFFKRNRLGQDIFDGSQSFQSNFGAGCLDLDYFLLPNPTALKLQLPSLNHLGNELNNAAHLTSAN